MSTGFFFSKPLQQRGAQIVHFAASLHAQWDCGRSIDMLYKVGRVTESWF
jgi:hypothetical protein